MKELIELVEEVIELRKVRDGIPDLLAFQRNLKLLFVMEGLRSAGQHGGCETVQAFLEHGPMLDEARREFDRRLQKMERA